MRLRTIVLFLMLFSFSSLFGLWTWHEMTQGDHLDKGKVFSAKMGSKKVGFLVGSRKIGGGTKDAVWCQMMNDGNIWTACPPQFTPQTVAQGITTGIHFVDSDNAVFLRYTTSNFQHPCSAYTINMYNHQEFTLHDFAGDESMACYMLEGVGNTLWTGTRDGYIFRSKDGGQNWDKFQVTTDSDIEISSIHFDDEMHGFAAGGFVEEEVDGMATKMVLRNKGAIWTTEDGGETWTKLINRMELMPRSLMKGDVDGQWFMIADNEQTLEMSSNDNPVRVVYYTTDDWETYDYFMPTANTGRQFSGSPYVGGAMLKIDGQLWIAGDGMDYKALVMMSEDGGDTWTELFLPEMTDPPTALFGWDKDHIFMQTRGNYTLKYGEENEKFPDEEESADEDSVSDVDDIETSDDDTEVVTDSDTVVPVVDSDSADEESDGEIPPAQDEGCGCSLVF